MRLIYYISKGELSLHIHKCLRKMNMNAFFYVRCNLQSPVLIDVGVFFFVQFIQLMDYFQSRKQP